jgi:PAS domain S-box-containing protein
MQRRDRRNPSESVLKAVLQNMSEAAVFRSADGRVVLWNRVAAEMFGYTAPEMIGEQADLLIPPGEVEFWREMEKRVRAGEIVRRIRAVRLAKDAKRMRVLLTLILVDKVDPARSDILEMYAPSRFAAEKAVEE